MLLGSFSSELEKIAVTAGQVIAAAPPPAMPDAGLTSAAKMPGVGSAFERLQQRLKRNADKGIEWQRQHQLDQLLKTLNASS